MSYLTALGYVLAIIGIIIVGGAIIAVLGKIVVNLLDSNNKRESSFKEKEVKSVSNERTNEVNYKNEVKEEMEETTTFNYLSGAEKTKSDASEDYNYTEVDNSKAKEEEARLQKAISSEEDSFASYKQSTQESQAEQNVSKEADFDDFDIDSMLDEVSEDVLEEEHQKAEEKAEKEVNNENSTDLDKYSIESFLEEFDKDEEESEEITEEEQNASNETIKEMQKIRNDIMEMLNEFKSVKEKQEQDDVSIEEKIEMEVSRRVNEKLEENLAIIEELKQVLQEKDEIIEANANASEEQINELKNQLEDVTNQLKTEKVVNDLQVSETKLLPMNNVEVVDNEEIKELEEDNNLIVDVETIKKIAEEEVESLVEERLSESNEEISELTKQVQHITEVVEQEIVEEVVNFQYSEEAQYEQRIQVLEERLRLAKKDLKINDKEYKPLAKVKKTLNRDKAKLRRKEAIAAKKKVALYGVNNYVDIDKEKAEKLAHELELLDGLRLSVSHCEEVMNSNADRYPILEHTHIILSNNISDLESDIATLNKELKALKDKKGEGENK